MSLENDISELVKSCDALKEVVLNKTKEIDNKVDQATSAVHEEIIEASHPIIYIDNINGSDENDGKSISTPLKTFRQASRLTLPGGSASIRLLSDYEFEKNRTAIFTNSSVNISSYPGETKHTIKFTHYKVSSQPTTNYMSSFVFYHTGSLEFYNLKLQLPDIPLEQGEDETYPHGASVIKSNSTQSVANTLNVRLRHVDLIVPSEESNEFNFIGNHMGFTNLVVHDTSYPQTWAKRNKFFLNGSKERTLTASSISNTDSIFGKDEEENKTSTQA